MNSTSSAAEPGQPIGSMSRILIGTRILILAEVTLREKIICHAKIEKGKLAKIEKGKQTNQNTCIIVHNKK